MGDNKTGQVSVDAAKVYEDFFLPALFQEWSPLVAEAAQIQNGHRVIDVACGTGALSITISNHVGPNGSVIGVDINEGMLNIARGKEPHIDWQKASAELLPFEDASFDCAVCQFGLMYFDNREEALREMMRVLRPGGSLAFVVWDKLENNPGFEARNQLWVQMFGDKAGDEIPYSLGNIDVLQNLLKASDIFDAEFNTCKGTARYSSISGWMHTVTKGWTQDNVIDDDQFDLLLQKAEKMFSKFETPEGTIAYPTSAHIVTARKHNEEND
jgi:ubiquinone/menaquinone biosynthesis C-methylase UbiE